MVGVSSSRGGTDSAGCLGRSGWRSARSGSFGTLAAPLAEAGSLGQRRSPTGRRKWAGWTGTEGEQVLGLAVFPAACAAFPALH